MGRMDGCPGSKKVRDEEGQGKDDGRIGRLRVVCVDGWPTSGSHFGQIVAFGSDLPYKTLKKL